MTDIDLVNTIAQLQQELATRPEVYSVSMNPIPLNVPTKATIHVSSMEFPRLRKELGGKEEICGKYHYFIINGVSIFKYVSGE